jgi:tetratricopeptide (TPR) repeat protein
MQQFADNADDWDSAWAHYHLADMLLEAGRPAEARPLCEAALPLAEKEKDPEVQATLWRVLGDIAVAENDYDRAAEAYQQAVFQAYRFQVEPEAPDPYTIRFYPKIAAQVAQSVVDLYGRVPGAALVLATRLRKDWDGCGQGKPVPELVGDLRAGDSAALVVRMFPAALADALLATEGARYASEVRAHLRALRGKAAAPEYA